jgi:ribosomal protein L11 methylase PrmA
MNMHATPTPIANESLYNAEMAKSLIDKIYFLDKVDANLFVDYGCADGIMLCFIEHVFPGVQLVGYDIDESMLEAARANALRQNPNSRIIFTSDWNEVRDIVLRNREEGTKSCLVLSSVMHEIHSYLGDGDQHNVHREIWGQAGVTFDYVAFRDMMVSKTASRPSDPMQVARIIQTFDSKRLAEWTATWGSIEENWSLTHFLLTYRYEVNWVRELKENYLPVPYEDFLASIPAHYFPVYRDHFTLPFLRRCVKDRFQFDLNERTHLKLVLEHRPN